MKVYIEFEVPITVGRKSVKSTYVYNLHDAEEFCRACEKLGYKIRMVNNEP